MDANVELRAPSSLPNSSRRVHSSLFAQGTGSIAGSGLLTVSVLAEFYSITNRANCGNSFGGFAFAPGTCNQPTGYLGGIGSTTSLPIAFQVPVSARCEF